MDRATRVYNLRTRHGAWYDLPPREAVVAAYAQFECRDFNWWNYPARDYDRRVTVGKHTVTCGDWCARDDKKVTDRNVPAKSVKRERVILREALDLSVRDTGDRETKK